MPSVTGGTQIFEIVIKDGPPNGELVAGTGYEVTQSGALMVTCINGSTRTYSPWVWVTITEEDFDPGDPDDERVEDMIDPDDPRGMQRLYDRQISN